MSQWAESNNQSGASPLNILQQIAKSEATNFTNAELNERYKTLMASNIDWRVEYIAHFYVRFSIVEKNSQNVKIPNESISVKIHINLYLSR